MPKISVEESLREANNARNRASATQWEQTALAKEAAHKKGQEELERLKQARNRLAQENEIYTNFQLELQRIGDSTPQTLFRGTLRTKFETNLSELIQVTRTIQNNHEWNIALLDAEISNRSIQQGDLLAAIGSAWNMVQSFLDSII